MSVDRVRLPTGQVIGSGWARAARHWRRIFTAIVALNVVLIVTTIVYHRSYPYFSFYYDRLVFDDGQDNGQQYRALAAQYHRASACPKLTTDLQPAVPTLTGRSGDRQTGAVRSPSGSFMHSIAIALAITTRGLTDRDNITKHNIGQALPFFHSLLPSFCRTASRHYDYHFFLAYDFDDPHLTVDSFRGLFGRYMMDEVRKSCPDQSAYTLHYVQCPYSQRVTWAQNDAAVEAYMAGVEYVYRINDDTEMVTPGWTETFISVLRHLDPPNVGVCGPRHSGGNLRVLTYEFTHRSHLEIFGCYYPRALMNWDGDVWITTVYRPKRSFQIQHIALVHTQDVGTRYKVTSLRGYERRSIVAENKALLERYLAANLNKTLPDPRKVIAMSINLTDPSHLWGGVRNAQLRRVCFPDWTMRVYVSCNVDGSPGRGRSDPESYKTRPGRALGTLSALGVDVREVGSDVGQRLPVSSWNYLAIDDPNVDVVLIANPEARLNGGEFGDVWEWLAETTAPVGEGRRKDVAHFVGSSQRSGASGLLTSWAASTRPLRSRLGKSIKSLLMEYRREHEVTTNFDQQFLSRVIWPKINDSIRCCSTKTRPDVNTAHALRNGTICPYCSQQLYNDYEESVSNQSTDNQKQSLLSFFRNIL